MTTCPSAIFFKACRLRLRRGIPIKTRKRLCQPSAARVIRAVPAPLIVACCRWLRNLYVIGYSSVNSKFVSYMHSSPQLDTLLSIVTKSRSCIMVRARYLCCSMLHAPLRETLQRGMSVCTGRPPPIGGLAPKISRSLMQDQARTLLMNIT